MQITFKKEIIIPNNIHIILWLEKKYSLRFKYDQQLGRQRYNFNCL